MATSIRTPTRARSSTLACSSPSTAAAPGIPVPVLSGTKYLSQSGSSSTSTSSNNSTGSSGNGSINNTPTIRKPKPRRPSLPSLSASTSQVPIQKSLSSTPAHLLQPAAAKDSSLPTLRSPKSVPRLNAESKHENSSMAMPSLIARPNTAFSTPRTLASSLPSPRIVATSRMGEGSHQRHGNATTGSIATTNTTASAIGAPSQIAKPVLRTQKSTGIKPPSIVTKPSVPHVPGSAVATPHLKGYSSQPPATPSPVPLTAALSGPTSTSPLTASSGVPVSVSPTLSTASSSSTSSRVRSRKRFNSDGDSGCFLSQASDCESTTSASAPSFSPSKPAIPAVPTKPIPAPPHAQLSTSIPGQTQKPPSRRPSAADIPAITTTTLPPSSSFATSSSSSSPLPTCLTLKAAILTSSSAPTRPLPSPPSVSATGVASSFTVATPTTPSPLKHAAAASVPQVPENKGGETFDANARTEEVKTEPVGPVAVQCTCPPPLTLPEHVKREMRREEEEHRQRECGLYEKIIELQIENANLKGEKETLNRVISRRDKMLLELQMQLKAMEFVCREHEIKVDIDMCPDEAIENWSFKESDEVYQRILLTTQDLLRSGSRCLEENMPSTGRSSSQHHRSSPTRTSSSSISSETSADRGSPRAVLMSRVAIAGISEGAQPLPIHKQQEDPLIFKQTSRPGTMKFDIHTLLKSEQDFKSSITRAALSQANLSQLNAIVEGSGRRALDCGDDRSQVFGMSDQTYSSEEYSEDDDEGQESEFEELGEDMIKYVDLQSNVAPRRDSRSSSFPKMIPGASGSATPDMSTAVLMKNLWNSNSGARRTGGTTPLQHPGSFHGHHHHHPSSQQHQQQHQHQAHSSYGSPANRSSGGSHASSHNSSVMEDYFSRGGPHQEGPIHHHPHHPYQHHGAPVAIGLGLTGMGRSPEQPSLERFLAAPPKCALPPSPLPSPRAYAPSMARSPLGSSTSSTFSNAYSTQSHAQDNLIDMMMVRPPPMMPLPPLPSRPRYSYRDHTKSKLLEFKRPSHGRTCSHGFAVEEVGQFLKRKTYGKTLTRDLMHRGHRRRDSV